MNNMEKLAKVQIEKIAKRYKDELNKKMIDREIEMKNDDFSHYLIYNVLGVDDYQGKQIDLYQNKGRFLYKYAGSFLEEATIVCFKVKFEEKCQQKVKVDHLDKDGNAKRPKKFEIDCLVENDAIEIKWRDATTDGDHITKEHTRASCIKEDHGYNPIRVMYYYPNRTQAQKIQKTLKTLYAGLEGEYYSGDDAWDYVKSKTEIDLKKILEEIAIGK